MNSVVVLLEGNSKQGGVLGVQDERINEVVGRCKYMKKCMMCW